jgi:hypothetical protein
MLALKDEKFVLEAGMFTPELRSTGNGRYLAWDSPLAGLLVKLTQDAAGRPTWQLISEEPDQPGTYTFTPAPPTAAVPGEVIAWIEEAAHPLNTLRPDQPLDDLAPFKEMVGDAELIWRTQEMLALIEWLRLYNADPQHAAKVRFAGMDIQQITPEMFDSVTRLVRPDHPELLQEIEQRYQGLRAAPGTYETYFGIALEKKTQYAAQARKWSSC